MTDKHKAKATIATLITLAVLGFAVIAVANWPQVTAAAVLFGMFVALLAWLTYRAWIAIFNVRGDT